MLKEIIFICNNPLYDELPDIVSAFPGVVLLLETSPEPCITATNLSVVGFGPISIPGYSSPSNFLIS